MNQNRNVFCPTRLQLSYVANPAARRWSSQLLWALELSFTLFDSQRDSLAGVHGGATAVLGAVVWAIKAAQSGRKSARTPQKRVQKHAELIASVLQR
jgi:hypothetical protein